METRCDRESSIVSGQCSRSSHFESVSDEELVRNDHLQCTSGHLLSEWERPEKSPGANSWTNHGECRSAVHEMVSVVTAGEKGKENKMMTMMDFRE